MSDDDLLPCPHCGSSNLATSLWCLDEGEVDAIECSDCFAGAPLTVWDMRGDKPWQDRLKDMPGEVAEIVGLE